MKFNWNGISSDSLGMIVEKYPGRPFPQRKCTIYSVAGRSGDLIVDEDAYTNVIQEYQVYVKGDGTLQTKLSTIAAWLIGTAGYQKLTDDYDTSIYRMARVANAVEFLNSLNKFGKATLQFDCKPQRYPVVDEVWSHFVDDLGYTFTYPSVGLLPAYPLIEITNKAANTLPTIVTPTLTIRIGTPAAIAKIVIDFSTQSIYNAYNNQRPMLTTDTGTWEKLGDGDTIYAVEEAGSLQGFNVKVTTRRFGV